MHTGAMAVSRSSDSPGVRFPPPLLFVLGFGLGLVAHRLMPVPLLPSRPALLTVAAWGLVIAGAALLGWALVTFLTARTAVVPNRPASALLARGPYRLSRNPMYLALTLLYAGLALWVNALWPLVALPLVLAALWFAVVRREEAYLARAFGADYAAYRARVRRWF